MMSPRLFDIVRVSYSSILWQRLEVLCLQMSGDVILCRSFTRPSTILAVMKACEQGYVHVVVLVVSFPYCKDLVPSSKHRLVSFLYHGMGLRLSFCTSTPIPCFCSLALGSPIQHVNPDAHTLDWFHFSLPPSLRPSLCPSLCPSLRPGDQEHEQFEDADTD